MSANQVVLKQEMILESKFAFHNYLLNQFSAQKKKQFSAQKKQKPRKSGRKNTCF